MIAAAHRQGWPVNRKPSTSYLNRVVEQHLFLVAIVCDEFRVKPWVETLGLDEATAIGNLAIVEASRKWDTALPFRPFAQQCIRSAIKGAFREAIDQPDDELPDEIEDYRSVDDSEYLLTACERRFFQRIEETKLPIQAAVKIISRHEKKKVEQVKQRHRRIIRRIREQLDEE